MIWFSLTIILLLAIFISLASHINVKGVHLYSAEKRFIRYEVRALFGLIRLNYEMPDMNMAKMQQYIAQRKTNRQYKRAKFIVTHIDQFYQWMLTLLKRIKCVQLDWQTKIGMSDAAETALLSGVAWGVKTTLIGALSQRLTLTNMPHLQVSPHFNEALLSTELVFKLQVRLFNLLRSLTVLLMGLLKVVIKK